MQVVKVGEAQISDGGFSVERCFTPEFENYRIGPSLDAFDWVTVTFPQHTFGPYPIIYATKES